jgi:hypothetical protein
MVSSLIEFLNKELKYSYYAVSGKDRPFLDSGYVSYYEQTTAEALTVLNNRHRIWSTEMQRQLCYPNIIKFSKKSHTK